MSERHLDKKPRYGAADPHQLANRFLKCHGRDNHGHLALRYWRDEFWQFREGRYRKLSGSELQARISEFIREIFQREKPASRQGQILQVTRSLVQNVMQALMGRTLVESQTEQPVWLGNGNEGPYFVFTNAMANLAALEAGHQTGAVPHCSHWFTQTIFPYEFDLAATCPRWKSFLNGVLESDQERIRLLQQWFGYCLTPDTSLQRFIVAVGEGANGKSVMLDTLTAMLGPENVSHIRAELFAQRFQLTMTLGKLANVSYDTGEIDGSAEATIKEFTGGDRMYFDRKGVPGVFAYPTARLILATNHDPRFADRSKGIWRRMIVLPFRVSIPTTDQDPNLATKLKTELSGIFNWAMEGLRELRRAGEFAVPAISQEAWEEFRNESNPAKEFFAETFESGSAVEYVAANELYQQYREWCVARGFKPLDATSLGKELRKVFPRCKRLRETTGERRWKYHGLRRVGVATSIHHQVLAASGPQDGPAEHCE